MIPKIIHYCWFGRGPKTPKLESYIRGWQKILPDFEIKEWNEDNFDVNVCDYTREAYNMKSYAHVSDVCRLFVLLNEGGIYLDTDVEVIKPFNRFLNNKSFIGMESSRVGTAVIGAEPNQKWIGLFIDYYLSHHLINKWGHPKRTPNSKILTDIILPKIKKELWPEIYPANYFCGIDWEKNSPIVDEQTYSIHHLSGSWRSDRTLKTRLITIFNGLKYRYIRCIAH